MHTTSTELIKRQSISELVIAYKTSVKEVNDAFQMLAIAHERLDVHFPSYGFPSEGKKKDILKTAKQSVWRHILNQTGVLELMSIKQRTQTEKDLSEGTLPDIEEETIWNFVNQLHNDVPKMLAEAVKEVFDWLRPAGIRHGWNTEFKTNEKSKWNIGRKIIKDWTMDTFNVKYGGHVCLSYSAEPPLIALHNVFSLLDGKGPIKRENSLPSQIRVAIQNKETTLKTEYFRCKWYKKGTLHIEILNDDLRKQLNFAGGNGTLKGN